MGDISDMPERGIIGRQAYRVERAYYLPVGAAPQLNAALATAGEVTCLGAPLSSEQAAALVAAAQGGIEMQRVEMWVDLYSERYHAAGLEIPGDGSGALRNGAPVPCRAAELELRTVREEVVESLASVAAPIATLLALLAVLVEYGQASGSW